MLLDEDAARRFLWPNKDARPTLKAFQRLRRIYGIPSSKIGRRCVIFQEDLVEYLRKKQQDKPEA